jgi:hypothetical protein
MQLFRNRLFLSLCLGSLGMLCLGCGKEPVTHSEELPPGRIPQMKKQASGKNAKAPKAIQTQTKAKTALPGKQMDAND